MPVIATYTPAQFKLSVLGTALNESIIVGRNAAGTLLVNNGAVPIAGGPATVANTDLIEVVGDSGNDTMSLDESTGALPAAEMFGGAGDDAITGGSVADTLVGEAGNDIIAGRGGNDILQGGADNDTLNGGDGDDQMFGEAGNDRMIWNPGDDSDLMEGGDGTDTAEVNAGNGAEIFTVTANGTRVRFDRLDPAPFALDIGTSESLVLNMNGGDDSFSASGNLAALIGLTIDGGTGNDTILGSNGADMLLGGDGNDLIDGNQGNDAAFLGAGDDVFRWDPGDGSDVVEGQAGIDQLVFNGSAVNEIYDLNANGGRVLLLRNVAAITMDLNDVETFTVNAGGGVDAINVNGLTGTDATQVTINLAGTIGGSTGDSAVDTVTVAGSAGNDAIGVTGAGTSISVSGLTAAIAVTNVEGANDALVVNGSGGNDSITATTLPAGVVKLTLDGGTGNDTLFGSQGNDTLLGGDGDDQVFGDNGNDVAFLGIGDDVFEWAPGDGNDIVEGQAGKDALLFGGSNASEVVNVAANGGRILFTRDVAAVTMDLDDVERIRFNAIGGSDTVIVGDLSGTDVTNIDLHLEAAGDGGDGATDTVTVNSTNVADVLTASSSAGVVSITGLPAAVAIFGAEGANDGLTLNGQGGDDTINANTLVAGLVLLTVNAGLGNDLVIGSAGGDLVNGGDGNDTMLLGAGNDTAIWNPGDDNDVIEGQSGTDTLVFNGANIAETITISPNGGRAQFFRDVANVTIDLNDTEVIQYAALGGADTITVGDLSGTDVTTVAIDLAATLGGAAGDALSDTLTLNGSGTGTTINLSGATGALLTVTGLPASVTISQFDTSGAVDRLTILAFGGNDAISATGLIPHVATLTLDGGDGNDTIRSNGDGTYLGGANNDFIYAGLTSSTEVLDGGSGVDTLDTTSWGGDYTISLITGVTNYSGESFVNFENLISGAGNDTITGTDSANSIRTNGGIDNVTAGAGDDVVGGGADADTLDGGDGIDTLEYLNSSGAVVISLLSNSVSGGDATNDVVSNFENVWGSAFGDVLTGNNGTNLLNGGAGADTLNGLGGNDLLYVDNAGDVVVEAAGGGSDRVLASVSYTLGAAAQVEILSTTDNAGTSAINLAGNGFAQTITGNAGANTLIGGAGADTLSGLGGNDRYYVDNVGDVVVEAAGGGSDRVFASVSYSLGAAAQVEILSTTDNAGTDAINLAGNGFANSIIGNAGANTLIGGAGADTLNGLGGNDKIYVDNVGDVVIEAAGGGSDRVLASVSYTLGAAAQVEIFSTTDNAGTAAINLAGNGFANSITGNAGANTLIGGAGADTLSGLGGNDRYYVDNVGDVVVEAAGGGSDRVLASVSYTLGAAAQVEIFSTTDNAGTDAINLAGNGFANSLIGNAGANTLIGGAGADTLSGLGGNDRYYVDNVGDVVVEAAGGGSDRVLASVSYTLGAAAQVEILSTTDNAGTDAINLAGNGFANSLIGNAGANTLIGGAGADTLSGLGGNDRYYVDNIADIVVEAAGGGSDRVFASVSYSLGSAAQVEILSTTDNAGTAAINLTGNGFANSITGNAGANVLDGLGGADTLNGLGGADTFRFTTALGAGNVDTITGYSVADDGIQLENAVFTGLAAGALAAGAFNTGAAASQADDRIIYNSATGALLFDVDGVGGAAGVQFATLVGGLALTASEFLVV